MTKIDYQKDWKETNLSFFSKILILIESISVSSSVSGELQRGRAYISLFCLCP